MNKEEQLDLTVCIITNKEHEQKYLANCLETLPNGCEIVIIYTQEIKEATDITDTVKTGFREEFNQVIKIANYYYIKNETTNTFSFSNARNSGLELATRKWILQLDSDEQLIVRNELQLNKLKAIINIDNENIAGINFTICSHYRTEKGIMPEAVSTLRMWRNNVKYRFRYRAHEVLLFSILEDNKNILQSDLVIQHHGYNVDTQEQTKKLKFYNELIFKDIANDPYNSYLNEKLATHYYWLITNKQVSITQVK